MAHRKTPKSARPTSTVRVYTMTRQKPPAKADDAATSKQLDPFKTAYASSQNGLMEPPYGAESYRTILARYDESDVLQSIIDAMVTNVACFGVQVVGYISDLPAAQQEAFKQERDRIRAWLDTASSLGAIEAVRERVRRDLEVFADGYYEFVRDTDGRLVGIEHVPAYTMRKSALSERPVIVQRWVRQANGEFQQSFVRRRVRLFAQWVNGKFQWFKEVGDQRRIRAADGTEADESTPAEELAGEVLNVCRYEPGSAYGKPRWRGAAPSIAGRSAAASVNHDLFDNNAIPPLAVLVEGGTLGPDGAQVIGEYFANARGRENRHTPLILEASSSGASDPTDPAGLNAPSGAPKLKFEKLNDVSPSDAQFLKYRAEASSDAAMAYRIPPIYLGLSRDYNRATAEAARSVAEEQVFQPERVREDMLLNAQLLPELGARLTKLKTAGPPLLNEDTLVKILELGATSGALTVENIADVLESLVGIELSSAAAWRKLPVRVFRALVDKGLVPAEISEITPFLNVAAAASKPEDGSGNGDGNDGSNDGNGSNGDSNGDGDGDGNGSNGDGNDGSNDGNGSNGNDGNGSNGNDGNGGSNGTSGAASDA